MPRILIADDEASIRTILKKAMEQKGFDVVLAKTGLEALEILQYQNIDVAIVDIRMPEMTGLDLLDHQGKFQSVPLIFVVTAQDTMENAIEAMKKGAYDYFTKPFDLDELSLLIDRGMEARNLKTELAYLRNDAAPPLTKSFNIVGKSKAIQEIYKTIGKVAPQDVTVLIEGESGTGKELVAKSIHFNSRRAKGPFVAVNCSAIPKDLLESEFFGHKRGAFTGASNDKTGFFEQAHRGTLFLDEIGELPQNLQAKLLRVLQEKEIQRVGESRVQGIDVRIIAATNKSLSQMVKKGTFREDLFFRLNVVPIQLIPLRERKSDIPLLVEHFLNQENKLSGFNKTIEPKTMELLKKHPWPGNIRELENLVKRVYVLTQGNFLSKKDFDPFLKSETHQAPSSLEHIVEQLSYQLPLIFPKSVLLEETELLTQFHNGLDKPLIEYVLKVTEGNQIKSASILGINRNTLRKLMQDLGISKQDLG